MNGHASKPDPSEPKLVKLYMDLTGTTESHARSVFMHVCTANGGNGAPSDGIVGRSVTVEEASESAPSPRFSQSAGVVAVLGWLALGTPLASAAQLPSQPLSLADAVNVALKQNPNLLKAQKDLEAAQGIVIQTRAITIPKVTVAGSFSAVERSDIDILQVPGFGLTFGNDKNWVSQIKLVQSLYEGGRLLSSLRVARLTKEQSVLNYRTTVADTVLAVEIAYFDVLLAIQQITVQEASVELLTRELSDTTKRFDAGTVPRFNVLRAEVELANARPKLIRARNSLRISKNNLANLLGFNLPKESLEDIPLTLSGKLEAEPFDMALPRAISLALERRTELGALRKAEALRKEDIVNAKAGYRPSLQAFAGYDIHNSVLRSDLTYEDHGWIAGGQLTWNLFDGLRTQGKVKEATANFERAGVELDDTARRIELDVRTAHSNFIEAREVLESQKKVVEEAEEALRLARARSEAGTGTQLDVLSAQTALTEARTTQIQALHDYEAARARLERAVGGSAPATGQQP
ncbi:MAG TPA: TolC family protein [Candidatus Binatia bacterium]|jgi:outer membrane protein|nr:TolC family protein [Candidatus Binatia bacterium]